MSMHYYSEEENDVKANAHACGCDKFKPWDSALLGYCSPVFETLESIVHVVLARPFDGCVWQLRVCTFAMPHGNCIRWLVTGDLSHILSRSEFKGKRNVVDVLAYAEDEICS